VIFDWGSIFASMRDDDEQNSYFDEIGILTKELAVQSFSRLDMTF
jgi:hypothetical protein